MQKTHYRFQIISVILLFCGVSFQSYSQEVLSPLRYNQQLKSNTSQSFEKTSDLNLSFIYLNDTISLPFIDDFSRDHFPKFDATPSDANVSDTTWYQLSSGGTPLSFTTTFMTDTTFRYEYDTVPGYGFDSIVETKYALGSSLVDVSDLTAYPVVTNYGVEVWPTTYTIDSLWTSSSPDVTLTEINPDLEQDSLTLYFVHPTTQSSSVYWIDNFAYRNPTMAINPLTIGVVTFDGIDQHGYPYDWTSLNASGKADVLTSKPINLSGLTGADSIYFSFFYQEGGLGEAPDQFDSLTLEFWSPALNEWQSVWRASGGGSTNDFHNVHINIFNPNYLMDGFQFRLSSYGSLTGSIDLWNVDYVLLDKFRAFDDTVMNDWAFQYPAPSMLNLYTSMPWPHYQLVPYSSMKTSTSIATFNSSNSAKLIDPCGINLSYQSTPIDYVPYANTSGNVSAQNSFNMDYTIPTTFWFDTAMADTCATFDIQYTLATPTTPERLKVNDTLNQEQYFCNYYSYDDGTAEAAYGLVAGGATLAYQFTMPSGLTDTIRAIQIHFEASVNDASGDPFFLQIWDDAGGQPGNLIYTTDDTNEPITFIPQYNIGVNGFYEYVLPQKVELSGIFYVGWKQTSANRLNIGFDKNLNNQTKIFYNLGNGWSNTGFQGSLMMRPVFVSDKDALYAGIRESKEEKLEFSIYPNPVENSLNINYSNDDLASVEILDLSGRTVIQTFQNNQIDVSQLPSGIYLVRISTTNNQQGILKFVK